MNVYLKAIIDNAIANGVEINRIAIDHNFINITTCDGVGGSIWLGKSNDRIEPVIVFQAIKHLIADIALPPASDSTPESE